MIILDKNILDPQKPFAKGLISALKKVSDRNIDIYIPGYNASDYPMLDDILKSENINFSAFCATEECEGVLITLSEQKTKNDFIIIRPDSPIDTITAAIGFYLTQSRAATKKRTTKETDIYVSVALDGSGISDISTGVGFFDHMLEQISRHGNTDLTIRVKGDLYVDEHHTVEDTGITLGETILEALGDKKGIKRYGFLLPMDESIAKCAIDLGGRTFLNFKCKMKREKVGDFPTELTEEFFRGLAAGMKANIYLRAKGNNDHHKIEAMFKAFAKSLNEACRLDERNNNSLPSTKGVL